jgi:hypothetical protein
MCNVLLPVPEANASRKLGRIELGEYAANVTDKSKKILD